jgi:cobalt/nickel transport system permease protein
MGIDEFSDIESPVHRWDPRFKFIGLIALIFAFSFIQDLRILPAMVMITAVIYFISSLPLSFLLRRLRYPSLFLLVIVLLLPFVSGHTVISSIGPLDIRIEGLISVVLITIRFLSILTIGLVIFSTAPIFTTLKAMRALGFPSILTDIALLAFRYVYETGDDLRRMQASMKLRGFRNKSFSIRRLGTLAWLGGSVLVSQL